MKTETYVVENKKLQSDQTLAVISDLHLKDKVDLYYYACMLGAIEGIRPDYIALVGDYFHGLTGKYSFEDPESREHLKLYLHSLREIAPVVMSLGNHDVQRKHDKEKREFKTLKSDAVFKNVIYNHKDIFIWFINRVLMNTKYYIKNYVILNCELSKDRIYN